MSPNQAIFSTFIIISYLLLFIKKYIPGPLHTLSCLPLDDADEPASEENGKIEEEIDEVEEKEEENEEEEGGEMKTEDFQPDNDEEARDEQQKVSSIKLLRS